MAPEGSVGARLPRDTRKQSHGASQAPSHPRSSHRRVHTWAPPGLTTALRVPAGVVSGLVLASPSSRALARRAGGGASLLPPGGPTGP